MKMQLACGCCGPKLCRKHYHVNQNRPLWIAGTDELISVSPPTPSRTSTMLFDPEPGTWIPDDRPVDVLLGAWGELNSYPTDNYYNINPDYFGPPHFLWPNFDRVDYSHPSQRRDGQFTTNDCMFQSGTHLPMFQSSDASVPGCSLGRNWIDEAWGNLLVGTEGPFGGVTKTFPKVPLTFDRAASFIVDGKTVGADFVYYWCSDAGSGSPIDQFDLGVDPFVVEPWNMGATLQNIVKRIGFDPDDTEEDEYGIVFVHGQEMDSYQSATQNFSFNNGEITHLFGSGGYENTGYKHCSRIYAEVINTVATETIPKLHGSNATGHYTPGGNAGPYGTVFFYLMTRATYDWRGAAYWDNILMGNPLPMTAPGSRYHNNEPLLLGDVTIEFTFEKFPTSYTPWHHGTWQPSANDATGALLKSWGADLEEAVDWRDPATEEVLELPTEAEAQRVYHSEHPSFSAANPRVGGNYNRQSGSGQIAATIASSTMTFERHNYAD